jgi:hypothetical protein
LTTVPTRAGRESDAHVVAPGRGGIRNAPVAEVHRVFAAPDATVIYVGELVYSGDHIRLEMDLLA